jgi:hypothetical protein
MRRYHIDGEETLDVLLDQRGKDARAGVAALRRFWRRLIREQAEWPRFARFIRAPHVMAALAYVQKDQAGWRRWLRLERSYALTKLPPGVVPAGVNCLDQLAGAVLLGDLTHGRALAEATLLWRPAMDEQCADAWAAEVLGALSLAEVERAADAARRLAQRCGATAFNRSPCERYGAFARAVLALVSSDAEAFGQAVQAVEAERRRWLARRVQRWVAGQPSELGAEHLWDHEVSALLVFAASLGIGPEEPSPLFDISWVKLRPFEHGLTALEGKHERRRS